MKSAKTSYTGTTSHRLQNQYLSGFWKFLTILILILPSSPSIAFTDPPSPDSTSIISTNPVEKKKRSKTKRKKHKRPRSKKSIVNVGSVFVFFAWLLHLIGIVLFIVGVVSTISEFWMISLPVMGGSLLLSYAMFIMLYATGRSVWGILSSTTVMWITQGVEALTGLALVIWGLVRASQIIWGIGGLLLLFALVGFLVLWLGVLGQGQV